jgi:hypothetical protein
VTIGHLGRLGFALIAVMGCRADAVAPQPTVYFVIDAPLCSSRIPVQFFIDDAHVGTDTFIVNLVPEHTMSAGFETTEGVHKLGARVVNGYVWPDSTVEMTGGQVFHDSLPFYCS